MLFAQTVRRLGRRARVVALVVLLLSLGMGAGTAGYAILDGILFRPHPVGTPSELVCIYELALGEGGRSRPGPIDPDFFDWFRSSLRGSIDLAAATRLWALLKIHGEVAQGMGEVVTTDYFTVLGVRPALGRTFSADDARPSNTTTAVVIREDAAL